MPSELRDVSVKVGDKVTRGQVIGNNVPYEIDRFTLVGSMATDALVKGPNAGERANQLPLSDEVVSFPK